jgi:hypothetical protein
MVVKIQSWLSRIRIIEIDKEVSGVESLAALVRTLRH